jgi:regulatory protein YycI of two-component signal transduction system YycFG
MNKKIASLFFLLIIFVSVALTYVYFNQPAVDEQKYDGSSKDVSDEDLADEIDDTFLDEDDEIEIGEMV